MPNYSTKFYTNLYLINGLFRIPPNVYACQFINRGGSWNWFLTTITCIFKIKSEVWNIFICLLEVNTFSFVNFLLCLFSFANFSSEFFLIDYQILLFFFFFKTTSLCLSYLVQMYFPRLEEVSVSQVNIVESAVWKLWAIGHQHGPRCVMKKSWSSPKYRSAELKAEARNMDKNASCPILPAVPGGTMSWGSSQEKTELPLVTYIEGGLVHWT